MILHGDGAERGIEPSPHSRSTHASVYGSVRGMQFWPAYLVPRNYPVKLTNKNLAISIPPQHNVLP